MLFKHLQIIRPNPTLCNNLKSFFSSTNSLFISWRIFCMDFSPVNTLHPSCFTYVLLLLLNSLAFLSVTSLKSLTRFVFCSALKWFKFSESLLLSRCPNCKCVFNNLFYNGWMVYIFPNPWCLWRNHPPVCLTAVSKQPPPPGSLTYAVTWLCGEIS